MKPERLKVLLVEDNLGDVRLVKEALADVNILNLELEHVTRLDVAMKRFREEHFDVTLLDLSLPDSQGLETFMRAYAQAAGVPIVVLTGLDDEGVGLKAVRAGAQDYLIKGQLDGKVMVRAIRYAIERKRIGDQLVEAAFHDALTGLPNRALFMDRLGTLFRRAKRNKDYLFGVLFLDLDRFKHVNDSLGHMIGDQLLFAVSSRVEACLRPGDTVARLGGDEFAILLEDISDLRYATRVANRIQKALSDIVSLSGHEVYPTASIGIAISGPGYDRAEDLLRDADTAMYRAKELGRARNEIFNPSMHTQAVALLQLETDLRRAIERQELALHYQPIVSMETGRITGFEALVWWQHPKRGRISPEEFIPIAEDTGLIAVIGRWVLFEACHRAFQWHTKYPARPPLTIAVNLSAKQFKIADLVNQVAEALQESGLDARRLTLEITESVLMDDAEANVAILQRLRGLGVQLHLDDFGTGYSSLSYLLRFPVDCLKVPRLFISGLAAGNETAKLLSAIVAVAHNLGLEVIAEGVETTEQLAHVKDLNCQRAQGYLFSRPVGCEAAEALIAADPKW